MPKPRRRIVVLTDTFLPQVNGVSTVVHRSVTGLIDRGWEVALVTPRYPAQSARVAGLDDHIALPSMPLPGYPAIRVITWGWGAVSDLIRRYSPDLIHAHTEFVAGRLGRRAARSYNIPFISSFHTNFAQYATAYGLGRMAGVVDRHLSHFHERSAAVLTPSHESRGALARRGLYQARVWGCGVDTTLFTPERRDPAVRASFGMGSQFSFLHVGRLAPEKNVELILEAYAEASARLPRGVMRLTVAGTGPTERLLRSIAPPDVVFLGELDRDCALPNLYANADAFLFASTTETLGLVVLEAMSSGLPVIAAAEGGVQRLLRDGHNGIVYPANDAKALAEIIVRMASYPDERFDLAGGARQSALQHDWEGELDELVRIYDAVIAGGVCASRPWKPHPDRRAASELTLGRHLSPVTLDQVPHDAQPEARPALFP